MTVKELENTSDKLERFRTALTQFIERIREDRYVLAVVLVGGLTDETIWRKESIGLWIVEADGVSRRLRSDGSDERIFRTLVENGVNLHAEVIPRSRFRQMVEGSSRTAFSCNFFASRELVYSCDSSIDGWFEQANSVAIKDQERELLMFSTWTIHALRHAQQLLHQKHDMHLSRQELLNAAHSVACTEIIRTGKVHEGLAIYRAMELNPELFETIYGQLIIDGATSDSLDAAIKAIEGYLELHHREHLKPLLTYLNRADRVVPLTEIGDHFAFSQVYPWHIEAACEWLEEHGKLQKLSTPFKLTKRSQHPVEEPAYYFER